MTTTTRPPSIRPADTSPPAGGPPQVIDLTDEPATASARTTVPVRRTLQTKSGSRYRIEGRRVRKLGEGTDFVLIDMHGDRLRYTDGERLFISTPVIATRAD